jgi:hypothetical protein
MNSRHAFDDAPTCIAPEPAPFGPIAIARGLGQGPTLLAAFDTTLLDAGVANYNLICLSSVIPPGSTIERRRWTTPPQHWGQRLYCRHGGRAQLPDAGAASTPAGASLTDRMFCAWSPFGPCTSS